MWIAFVAGRRPEYFYRPRQAPRRASPRDAILERGRSGRTAKLRRRGHFARGAPFRVLARDFRLEGKGSPGGVAAAAAATWASLALLPAKGSWLRLGALAALATSFFRGSVVSGFDVARRALRPQLDLHPGFGQGRPSGYRRGTPATRLRRSRASCRARCRSGWTRSRCSFMASMSLSRSHRIWRRRKLFFCGCSAMNDLLLAAAGFILLTVAVGTRPGAEGTRRCRSHDGCTASRNRRDRRPSADRVSDDGSRRR